MSQSGRNVLVGARRSVALESDIKAQPIRVLDVVAIGPVMIAGGIILGRKGNPILGGVLGLFGATTIAYNARNYVIIERRRRKSVLR